MKHCVIRHNQLNRVTADIQALAEAGLKCLWTLKKSQGEWMATSTAPVSLSLMQLKRAVA